MKMKLISFIVALKLKCLKISLAKAVYLFTKTIKLLKLNQIKFNQLKCL